MRFVKSLAVATLAILVCSAAMALDGGYKDTNTGKVWSDSFFALNYGSWNWSGATNIAANYAVWDLNDNGVMTYYDDWRLPTVAEMQAAIADGTIQYINQHSPYRFVGNGNGIIYFWTSNAQGKGSRSAYVVGIRFGPNGEVLSSQASLALVTSSVCAYMIRP